MISLSQSKGKIIDIQLGQPLSPAINAGRLVDYKKYCSGDLPVRLGVRMQQIRLFAEWYKSSSHVSPEMTGTRRASVYFKYYYRGFGDQMINNRWNIKVCVPVL